METENRIGEWVKGMKGKAGMDGNGEQIGSTCERGERKG